MWERTTLRVLTLTDVTAIKITDLPALRAAGIGVNVHYIPVHTQPYYRKLGFETGMFPESESYYEDAITLPLFSRMTNDEQDTVVAALENILA